MIETNWNSLYYFKDCWPMNCQTKVVSKIVYEKEDDGFVHTQPGMYKVYNGPRIGEIRLRKGEAE